MGRLNSGVSPVQLHLGFFDNFKGGDKVLLSGGAADVAAVAALLERFVRSGEQSLAIHEHVLFAPRQSVPLFAVAAASTETSGYSWLCNSQTLPDIMDKLALLDFGHQYFDLLGTTVELMVSTGEYGREWWQAHG